MNTGAVAKLLGVSQSTIQRWVKQLKLETERNELGHYLFTKEDIFLLKQVHEQLNRGVLLQNVEIEGKRKARKGVPASTQPGMDFTRLLARMDDFEQRLNAKADDVTSYQLLHHRSEIEELQEEIVKLNQRVIALEKKQEQPPAVHSPDNLLIFDQETPRKRMKKKNILTMLFGF
ncbi:MerR family transcriptional regulator [Cytobacillus purgationiresistens]|uniref:Chromosome-anchoring protein RacA n=1 Tax=Cytobacillus purgationiresistens TaxID=863449 RepID=A0ABU0AHY2_9BACI|nr:MerR family transcriptional regulator [Cytobacillus purgationiresistens]MDQ0270866.1 chromosome-anchoring protein RacA [Cytobacillus purgationiresistens]